MGNPKKGLVIVLIAALLSTSAGSLVGIARAGAVGFNSIAPTGAGPRVGV